MLYKELFFNLYRFVHPPKYGFIYKITLGASQHIKLYKIIIGDYLTYTCMDFSTMMASSLGGQGKWCIINTFIIFFNM